MNHISSEAILIYIMVTAAAVDAKLSECELKRIADIASTLPIFSALDRDDLRTHANACTTILNQTNGVETILAMARDGLHPDLHDTAYAMAIEVVTADLTVEHQEVRFLQTLRRTLGLDALVTGAIEWSARARFRTLDAP